MALENWLTEKAIKALYDFLEKNPITISGLDTQNNRELVIWVSQAGRSKKSSKKG